MLVIPLVTTAAAVLAVTTGALPSAAVERPSRAAAVMHSATSTRLGDCAAGQLCLWDDSRFTGRRRVHELAGTDIDSCVPLPRGSAAGSLANRTGRPVTAYQSVECGETGEFDTYPTGSWAPESPYLVRAFKIWES